MLENKTEKREKKNLKLLSLNSGSFMFRLVEIRGVALQRSPSGYGETRNVSRRDRVQPDRRVERVVGGALPFSAPSAGTYTPPVA